jgi:hypothetical protein
MLIWRSINSGGVCMSNLRIALLGPPEVDHRDYRLTFSERKALALLAYLATEGGVHERQKLTRLLWPESDMAHGRTALRITLLHLRHILEEDASPECQFHLLITHGTLGLNLATGIDLDLHALQWVWKSIRYLPAPEAVQGEVRRTLIAQFQRVADLYRGSFLQDFTLRERYPDLPPPTSDRASASSRLFEALARLSQALAAKVPLLIFVDDLQWTGNAILDMFQYLARYWTEHGTPVMLLLSRRTETRETEPEMSEWLASLRKAISLTRLELGPLSAQDTREIALSLAEADGAQPWLHEEHNHFEPSSLHLQNPESKLSTGRFAAWLFAETQGQPFFVRATLEALLDRGGLVPRLFAGSGWVFEPQTSILDATPPGTMLSPGVRELIQRRLARLSPPAHNLLRAGAVLDHDFTFEELCQVARLAPQEGLAALDEALQNLLLHESSQLREGRSQVSYHFAHDKIREVVSTAAGDARRRVFHKRALKILKLADTTAAAVAHKTLPRGLQVSTREKLLLYSH